MEWIIWIPIWIGAFVLGIFGHIAQEKNTKAIIIKQLRQTVDQVPTITHKNHGVFTSVFIDGKEYVSREIYDEACKSFFRLSEKSAGVRNNP